MMLFLMGASSGAAYAVPASGIDDVRITQQTGTCTGVVVDAAGETVIGASVIVKGTTNGTITDFDGNFSLSGVKNGDVIQISFVGYLTQEVKFKGEALKVVLQEDTQTLGEVVVTGYGGVQKAKTMTASASVVKVTELAKLPVASMSEGLGGRVTGVVTQQASGAPGENAKIWVRGGANILYVIDDVVMDSEQGNEFFNRLRPDDIASMSVLKDAAATAVYGPRAANGVVVIATKRGQEGAPTITVNQKISLMTPAYRAEGMRSYDYARARNEVEFASFAESPSFNNTELSKYYMGDLWQKGHSLESIRDLVNERYNMGYTQQEVNDLFNPMVSQGKNIQDYYSSYDPWDMFDHNQPMYQTNVSMRGGSERIKYYSSLGYMNQQGVGPRYEYEQVNMILNTDAMLLKDKSLKFTFNLNGNTSNNDKPSRGEGVFNEAMYGDWMPKRPGRWSTGLARKNSVDAMLDNGFNNTESYRFQMNAALKWNVPWVEGLSAQASLNFTTSYAHNRQFNHDQENVYDAPYSTTVSSYNPEGANLYEKWNKYKLLTGIFQVDYARSFGKHNMSAMVNYQSQVRKSSWTDVKKKGYPTTLAPQIDLGGTLVSGGGNASEWGSASIIGRFTYDYDNKYLFQYSANYNGSLSYSPDKRWGYFQAVSLGWVLSDEAWFKEFVNPNIVNLIKLRGGFGLVGNEVGEPFSYLTQYAQSGDRILFGDNMTSNVGWYEHSVANDLKWSSSKQWGFGLDFGLLKDKLTGSVDAFLYLNKGDVMEMTAEMIRTDILGAPNTPKINAPFTTSRKGGFEFSVNWQDKIGQVDYRIGLNYSYWDERVTRHNDTSSDWWTPTFDNIGKRPYKDLVYPYGLKTNGLHGSWSDMYNSMLHASRNMTLGTPVLEDLNGDGRVDDYYVFNAEGSTPHTQAGLTLGAAWKGFDIELFFQGATGVSGAMPSPLRSQQSYMWNYGQYAFQNAYTPSNPDTGAAIPTPVPEGNGFGYSYIDIWSFDASYLKLKNISLRYDLKRSVLKNVSAIQGCDLSFVVTNAFLWTKDSYPLKDLQDPEFITTGASIYNANGTLGSYPTQRSYTLGVTITL
ncbi:TonB-dependent receptor plug domain protein [gut metagenome]|uniref:TonB-dependent receptor plug domain protein n=1 Tax=gut metagenome TaxID=749906 RepID=J9GJ40_9ZZZZ